MKKKLVLLGPAHPYRGGIAAFNHQLAYTFLNHDWEVKLINFTYQYPGFLFPGKDQFTDEDPPQKLNIERKIHTINPINWIIGSNDVAKENAQLVIAQYWMPQVGLSTGNYLKRIKRKSPSTTTVNLIHNLIPHEQKPGDKWLIDFQMEAADYMVSLSEAVKEDILSVRNDRNVIDLFHPIYDHYGEMMEKGFAKNELGLDKNSDYLLFFGLVRKYKGLDLLITALGTIKDQLPNKKLLVVGEFYEDISIYQKLISENNLEDRVIIVNEYVSSSEIKKYFSAADLVVLPYKTATQSGITQIGLCFEKAMIATQVGGLHEVIKQNENGFLVPVEARSLSNAILKFYLQDLETKFSKGSKMLKSDLSWDNFYIRLIKALEIE